MQSRKLIAIAALVLMLAGCGAGQPAGPAPRTTAAPTAASTAGPTAQPAPPGQPWAAKVPWLSTLPDPAKVDRSDPMAVAKAYTVTRHTWDSSIDRTEDYALKRAGVYGSDNLKRSLEPMDPDLDKGQALIVNETPFRTWTSASITFSGREGRAAHPGTDVIVVSWRMDLHRRKDGSRRSITGDDDVKLIKGAAGQWQVEGSITREPAA